jgi:hypothetical protein
VGGEGSGKPKAELLRLDGVQIDSQGKKSKTDFFNFLDTDLADYSNIKLTPAQALRYRNHIVRMKTGVAAMIPMLCGGPKCMVKQCPFHIEKNWPLTFPCPIESRYVQVATKSYIEDLEVDPGSITEMILVNRLVELDLLDYRANIGLSGGNDEDAPTLLKRDLFNNGSTISETTSLHPLLEAKEKTDKQRMNILEHFVATRKEKYKKANALGTVEDKDAAGHMSDLKELVDRVRAGTTIVIKESTDDNPTPED